MSAAANAFLKKAKALGAVQALARSNSQDSDSFLFGRDNHDAEDFDRRVLNEPRTPTHTPQLLCSHDMMPRPEKEANGRGGGCEGLAFITTWHATALGQEKW